MEITGNVSRFTGVRVIIAFYDFGVALCKHCVEQAFLHRVASLRRYENLNFGDIGLGSALPRLMRVVADAMDRDPRALAEAEEQWQAKRREIEGTPGPERPDRVPGKSLGILSTEPLPRE